MTLEEEGQLADEIRAAGKAREVLENVAFKDAASKIEQALLMGMRNAAISDDKLRLRLLDKYECLHALLGELRVTVETGLLAEEQIRQASVTQKIKDMLHIS
jgi:hypothetical protein